MITNNAPVGKTDHRKRYDFINDLTAILTLPNLHVHTRRSIIWKVIDDYSNRMVMQISQNSNGLNLYWSSAVLNSFKDRPTNQSWNQWKGSLTEGQKLHLEHVVPIKIFVDMLAPLEGNPPSKEEIPMYIERIFNDWVAICWVTAEENSRLNPKKSEVSSKNLKSAMPDNWSMSCPEEFKEETLFARYKAAHVNISYENIKEDSLKQVNSGRRNKISLDL